MAPLTPWREWIGAPRGAALLALLASAVAMTAATSSSRLMIFRNRYWGGSDGTQVERDARLRRASSHPYLLLFPPSFGLFPFFLAFK